MTSLSSSEGVFTPYVGQIFKSDDEAFEKKANVEHPRERKSVRCGCDAKLYLTKEIVDGNTQWYISQFSNVHNYELLEDDQVHLLPAYRKIKQADQECILLLSKAGFPVNRIVKVLEIEKEAQLGQLPFIEKDVRNFIRACKKTVQENDVLLTEKRENDMLDLLEACKDESAESFSWALQYEEFKSEFDVFCHPENIEDFEHQRNHLVARLGSDKHT
ncbi:FAR1-related sequence 10 [Actinidia rufa]|uniref:Protein FAR1-RELATED SEQUENCE n=1 Tax=Actinidia rufa TaxID=165716 RepID=A0A7J0G361_9ERIC|nr:FAR1-related sequence 10 [Actinidia rufa]